MTQPTIHTAELVERAQEGDAEAYERLFARVGTRLLTYARVRLGARLKSQLDPLDVVQEVYVRAHQAFPTFQQRHEQAFVPWLLTIADHCLRDLAEHHGAKKRRPPAPLARNSTALVQIRARHTDPASRLSRDEDTDRLVAALAHLSDDEREALLLRYFQDKTVEETVAALGKSRATVMRVLARARINLGRLLRAEGGA